MNSYSAEKIYREVCQRWQTKPNEAEIRRWSDTLQDVTEEEARAAIEQYAEGPYRNPPFSGTIRQLAQENRKRTATNSLSPGNPFPDKDKDNRRFLEWMANEEGKTPEEMEKHINEFMSEWEKGNK